MESPNLKAVPPSPNSTSEGGTDDGAERRRFPRLSLADEQFRLSSTGKIFSVVDLSEAGMGVRVIDRADLLAFTVGASIEGTLSLNREKIPVRARVRRLAGDRVGCQFEAMSPESEARLKSLLDPARLGAELKPIPAPDGSATWYHGPSGTDLLLWRGWDGAYTRFSLFVMGSYVQWEEGKGTSTGKLLDGGENAEVRGVVRFETLRLQPDSKIDAGKLSVAKTVIQSSNLSQDLKTRIKTWIAISR